MSYSNKYDGWDYDRHAGLLPEKKERASGYPPTHKNTLNYISTICPQGQYDSEHLNKRVSFNECPHCGNWDTEEKLVEWVTERGTLQDALMAEYYCPQCKKEFAKMFEHTGTLTEVEG